jgi:hypothetical protein
MVLITTMNLYLLSRMTYSDALSVSDYSREPHYSFWDRHCDRTGRAQQIRWFPAYNHPEVLWSSSHKVGDGIMFSKMAAIFENIIPSPTLAL